MNLFCEPDNAGSPDDQIVRRAELARALGVTERQVGNYVKRGMPKAGRGRFHLATCLAWQRSHVKPTGRGDGHTTPDRGYWETFKVREQALQERIARRRLQGQLIEVDAVARHAEQRITHAKALLLQIPDRVLGLLGRETKPAAKRSLRARVAEMIDDALTALAEAAEQDGSEREEADA